MEYQVCERCRKHTIAPPTSDYEELYTELKKQLASETSVFEYLFWEKRVGSAYAGEEGNTSTWTLNYKFVSTPKITGLEALLGVSELSCIE